MLNKRLHGGPAGIQPQARRLHFSLLFLLCLLIFNAYATMRLAGLAAAPGATLRTDSSDYLTIAAIPIWDINFWTHTRSMAAPLIYKLVSGRAESIPLLQTLVSVAGWGLLAASLARRMRAGWLKAAAFAAVLLFSLSADITQWDSVVMSESLSLSFLALWVAAWLWLLDGWHPLAMAAVAVVGFLFVFTREVNAYLGLAAGVILIGAYLWKRHAARFDEGDELLRRQKALALGLALAAIFALNAPLSARGERWVFPLLNVIAQRILPSEEFTRFFTSRGMPVNSTLRSLEGQWGNSQDSAFYNSDQLRGFQAWLYREGRVSYYDFLFSHLGWTLADPVRNAGALLSPQVRNFGPEDYQGALPGWVEEMIYPEASSVWAFVWLGLTVGMLAAVAVQRRKMHPAWLAGAAAVALVYPHAALVYQGDVMEMARHAVGVAVQARLGVWLTLAFALDGLTYPQASCMKGRNDRRRHYRREILTTRWRDFTKFLGHTAQSAEFLAAAWLAVSALEGLTIANHFRSQAYSLMPMLLLTLALALWVVWVYRKPQTVERGMRWLSPEESKARLYGASLGLLALIGACILALALFSPANSGEIIRSLSVSTRLMRMYGAAQALLGPLLPGIAWLGLMAAQALGALVVVFKAFYRELWRAGVVYRLGAAALVVAAGIGQMALLYLRLPGLQEISGWRYPYRALDVGLSGHLVFLGLLALASAGTVFLSTRPKKPIRNAFLTAGLWLALEVGFIFLIFPWGAYGILADGLVYVVDLPFAGLALLGLILTGIALKTPAAALLMLVAPVFLIGPQVAPFEINRYALPFVGVMALWLGQHAMRRSALWAALAAGFLLGAGTAIAAPMAALFGMVLGWIWLDAGLQTERNLRRTAILSAALAAGAGAGLLSAVQMGNHPMASYLANLAAARSELGLHLGLYSWLVRVKLDPFELAFLAGLPLAGLAGLRILRAGYAFAHQQAGRLDALALAFSAALAALVLALPPFGGTAIQWLFLLPPMALLAGDEAQTLFPGRWAALAVAMQLVICFLVFRFL